MASNTVSLSIKGVPVELAARLRQRAARHHRSLQRELLAIVEAAVEPAAGAAEVALRAAEPEPRPAAAVQSAMPLDACAGEPGNLLAELDRIVAGSRFGHAPLLSREQANDRRLAREIEFDATQSESANRS